jgi:hypothetical protein
MLGLVLLTHRIDGSAVNSENSSGFGSAWRLNKAWLCC